MNLKQRLLRRITSAGPIPFEEFMAAALYDPQGGFFTSKSLRSVKAGDFLTSPEVSPLFGATLARFVGQELERVARLADGRAGDGGRPAAVTGRTLVEVGAGSGSLLRSLLPALELPVEVWAVEAAPAAREALAELLPIDHVVGSLDALPSRFAGVVLANELIDNLPVSLAVRTPDGWEERWVGAEGETLALVPVAARPEVAAWADGFGMPCPVGGLVEVQLGAGEWLREALGRLQSGAVVVIDYGDTAEGLEPRRSEGTLRTYRAHHLGPHPLDQPGDVDITVDVNFTALMAVAEQRDATVEYRRQEDFLASLGLRDRLGELRRRELEHARRNEHTERLKLRSLVTEVETLLHPRGLGDFRVLVAMVG